MREAAVGFLHGQVSGGLAQRYSVQALRLAHGAQNTALGAEILAGMSHQSVYLGHADTGADLARAALTSAREAGIPALIAEAHAMEAHARAAADDERGCMAALNTAERTLDRADRHADPLWIGYFDEAYLAAKFGQSFLALGKGEQAARFAERSLDMDNRYARGKVFNLLLLARSQLSRKQPDPERACEIGAAAVAQAGDLRSARVFRFLRDLDEQLTPFASVPCVSEFRRSVLALSAGAASKDGRLQSDDGG